MTFRFRVWNPLLSYCAGSSVLGTSGNVFLLTGGGNSGLRHREKKAKGCKNKQLFSEDSPLCSSKLGNLSVVNRPGDYSNTVQGSHIPRADTSD